MQGESSTDVHAVSAGKALAWSVRQDQLPGGTRFLGFPRSLSPGPNNNGA